MEHKNAGRRVQAYQAWRKAYGEHGVPRREEYFEPVYASFALALSIEGGQQELVAMKATSKVLDRGPRVPEPVEAHAAASDQTHAAGSKKKPSKAVKREKMMQFIAGVVCEVVDSVPEAAEAAADMHRAAIEVRFDQGAVLSADEMREMLAVQARRLSRFAMQRDQAENEALLLRADLVGAQAALGEARVQQEGQATELKASQAEAKSLSRALADARVKQAAQDAEIVALRVELNAVRAEAGSLSMALCEARACAGSFACHFLQELEACQEVAEACKTDLAQDPRPDMEERGLCCVCMEEVADRVVVPCGHVPVCSGCVAMLGRAGSECPICRQAFEAVYPVFLV